MKCDNFLFMNGTLCIFLLIFLTLISDNAICMEKAYTPKVDTPERKAILNALREGLKHFPDKEPSGIGFKYKREDVGVARWLIEDKKELIFIVNYLKVGDDWAWVEVTGKNYYVDIVALLNKKDGKWEVRGIVQPAYVMCLDYEECIDVKAYIYKRFMERFPLAPADIFPKIEEERKQILKALSNLPAIKDFDFKMIFVVKYFKAKNRWAWIETNPRSPDGRGATEPVDAILHKEKGGWVIKAIRPTSHSTGQGYRPAG